MLSTQKLILQTLKTQPEKMRNRAFTVYLFMAIAVIMLDQSTKLWIVQHLPLHHSIPVSSVFSIVRAHNYGAAFGFLNNAGGWQTLFFTTISVLVSVVLIIWLRQIATTQRQLSIALALVLGGAIGNLIDRLQYQYVVDFLFFYYDKWQFPAFNVADSAITIGAILLILDSFGWKLITDREPPELNAK